MDRQIALLDAFSRKIYRSNGVSFTRAAVIRALLEAMIPLRVDFSDAKSESQLRDCFMRRSSRQR